MKTRTTTRIRTRFARLAVGALAATVAAVSLAGAASAGSLDPAQAAGTTLSVEATVDPDVEGRDFLTWQRQVGPSASGDLADWQANYGAGY
jgi:hypothetical protein